MSKDKNEIQEQETQEQETQEQEAPAQKAPEQAKEKMVKIRLPREKKDQGDEFVGVNGRTWLIKRGVTVEVPECVAEVLRHREEMLETIMEYEEANAQKA